jgi:hypothetical protein
LSGSPNLGPLEIDVSDSNGESESSDMPLPVRKKRKASESEVELVEKKPVKKLKGSGNNLLKTLSPGVARKKAVLKEEESDSEVIKPFRSVLRIRDPLLFYPLDPGSGSGMSFFRISDPGSKGYVFW